MWIVDGDGLPRRLGAWLAVAGWVDGGGQVRKREIHHAIGLAPIGIERIRDIAVMRQSWYIAEENKNTACLWVVDSVTMAV